MIRIRLTTAIAAPIAALLRSVAKRRPAYGFHKLDRGASYRGGDWGLIGLGGGDLERTAFRVQNYTHQPHHGA
jgi:hypothetical protein